MKKIIFTTVLILFGFISYSQVNCDGQRRPIDELEQEERRFKRIDFTICTISD